MVETTKIYLLDTTLRDGEQTQGVSFAPDEKVNIARALLQGLKVDRIEIASAGVSHGEKEAVSQIHQWAAHQELLDRVEVLGFVDGSRSVDWVVDSGGRVLNLLTKASERHCRIQLRKTLEEHIVDIRRTVDYARSKDLIVNVYLEDWSNGYRDSRDYVYQLVDALQSMELSHVMLPDTLGVLGPSEVFDSIHDMCSRYPGLIFDFHPHNDYGLATANAMAAVEAGVSTIHATINCLGERAGNVSLAEIAIVLRDKLGAEISIDESKIHDLSQLVENFSGKRVAANTPIIGADVFTQTSGIHADGDKKGNLYQTNLSPERFGRKHSYALGKMSGRASLVKNLEQLGMQLSAEQQEQVLQRIIEIADSKATITREDLPFIIADILENRDYQHIELLSCSIHSGYDIESTASLRVRVGEEIYKSSGSGNGGFDAFNTAMRKILDSEGVSFPELTDFEIHIPKGGSTNALTECFITWDDGRRTFKTRGVHANQVFAGVNATIRMLNMILQSHIAGDQLSTPLDRPE
ncbi:MAG: 2-isopropylmalate synthase [Acidiferrobacteraceae bacterium]|nr:2-isopropylmalate synthase [Acidiferrobacteraceae bacterium]|tara:strand:- start:1478 stop:3046 length:1569 start_codon:yes stop_codon:yes gene_type:complete